MHAIFNRFAVAEYASRLVAYNTLGLRTPARTHLHPTHAYAR